MKAAVVKKTGELIVEEVPIPEINEYRCLVKIFACSTCNATDLKLINGKMFWQPPFPFILGHESVGKIVETGSKVKYLKKGDIVSRVCAVYPGEKLGIYHSALGGFAEYGLVTDVKAIIEDGIPEGKINSYAFQHEKISPEINIYESTMLINLAEVLNVVKNMEADNKKIVIIGDGTVGLTFVKLLKLTFKNPVVILIGHWENRLAIGKKFGAEYIINSRERDFVYEIEKNIGKVDYLIDTVGEEVLLDSCFNFIKSDGKYLFYASPDFEYEKLKKIMDKRFEVVSPDETQTFNEVISLVKNRKIVLSDFYSLELPFLEINNAFSLIKNRKVELKIIIKIN